MTVYVIRVRRGSSTEWLDENPVLLDGEVGYETTTRRFKVGDGVTVWENLPYAVEGPPGPTGPGVTIKGFVANQAALPASSAVSDLYIAQDTLTGWMWSGSAWVNVGPVQGPKGEPGVPGPRGERGPQGPPAAFVKPATYRDLLP